MYMDGSRFYFIVFTLLYMYVCKLMYDTLLFIYLFHDKDTNQYSDFYLQTVM